MVADIKTELDRSKAEVESKFNELEARRQALVQTQTKCQAEINNLLPEMARLQGEFRQIETLRGRLNSEHKEG